VASRCRLSLRHSLGNRSGGSGAQHGTRGAFNRCPVCAHSPTNTDAAQFRDDAVGAIMPKGDGLAFVVGLWDGLVHDHREYRWGDAIAFPDAESLVLWAVASRCGLIDS